MNRFFIILFVLPISAVVRADDGYRLWLKYDKIEDETLRDHYLDHLSSILFVADSEILSSAQKELRMGLRGMIGEIFEDGRIRDGSLLIYVKGKRKDLNTGIDHELLGNEGFAIRSILSGQKKLTIITANTDKGILYGVFHFLRLIRTHQKIDRLNIIEAPLIQHRVLNHWDNLDRHVERGYAGISIWNWHTLPQYIDPRYIDYARANASIGINGTVLTNVNSNALILTPQWIKKVKALADVFRPYGIQVYLTARFSAPVETGQLKTADPLNDTVRQWWKDKVKEIYEFIPDFGGFLVKANSEGQPGPQNYGRTHSDGANMLADAVSPFGGIIMWRAFVYSHEIPEDRFKQAYNEFQPLDGKFRKNVLIQVKNGPIDFQPREPFSPLFGAMPETPLMMEFQVTQEYLGQGTHLVYEAPMFREVLQSDTWQQGRGSTVAKVIDGSLHDYNLTGIAGVSNIGNDRNWTGHVFGQANWYAYGRLAWDHRLTSEEIAKEWVSQTFHVDEKSREKIRQIMMGSYETMVNYMTPLGLNHIMGTGHHFGPAPWVDDVGRDDWNPVYYHRASEEGLGFDRTRTGSNALSQYAPEVRKIYENMNTCPEEFLLWFHHVPWDYKMNSGKTMWDELCSRYQQGVDSARQMQKVWNALKGKVDEEIFHHVKMMLDIQTEEALWWKDACLLYFQTFSKRPFPSGVEKPEKSLEYYKSLRFPYAPGQGR